jgi:5,10-methylene-tetrahydrofolate dehydrogenase/methenyl tetrahydrofolate cyclohydrolase
MRRKREACKHVGIHSRPLHFDTAVGEETLIDSIDVLNAHDRIDCSLLQQ